LMQIRGMVSAEHENVIVERKRINYPRVPRIAHGLPAWKPALRRGCSKAAEDCRSPKRWREIERGSHIGGFQSPFFGFIRHYSPFVGGERERRRAKFLKFKGKCREIARVGSHYGGEDLRIGTSQGAAAAMAARFGWGASSFCVGFLVAKASCASVLLVFWGCLCKAPRKAGGQFWCQKPGWLGLARPACGTRISAGELLRRRKQRPKNGSRVRSPHRFGFLQGSPKTDRCREAEVSMRWFVAKKDNLTYGLPRY